MLLLQEIFGVGTYIRAVAERLAGLGYVVGAPDVFWRIQRNWEAGHDEAGLNASFGMISKFDFGTGIADCVAALGRLREEPEVQGGAGVMGFCLGGLLTYHVAVQGDPDVAVSYYGSNTAAGARPGRRRDLPDPVPLRRERRLHPDRGGPRRRGRPSPAGDDAEVHIHANAGHAFDNHESAMFHHPEAAAASWEITKGFLAQVPAVLMARHGLRCASPEPQLLRIGAGASLGAGADGSASGPLSRLTTHVGQRGAEPRHRIPALGRACSHRCPCTMLLPFVMSRNIGPGRAARVEVVVQQPQPAPGGLVDQRGDAGPLRRAGAGAAEDVPGAGPGARAVVHVPGDEHAADHAGVVGDVGDTALLARSPRPTW